MMSNVTAGVFLGAIAILLLLCLGGMVFIFYVNWRDRDR